MATVESDRFAIVRALARAALANPTPAVRKQVERLRDALEAEGRTKEAEAIAVLLTSNPRTAEMAPSRIVRSAAALQLGESLSPNTSLPVDRETSTPLAEVLFPSQLREEPPILEEFLGGAIMNIAEEWKHAGVLADAGIASIRSVLIYGPPGTGKTKLALWMAGELNLPVLLARLDGLVSSFLGTTSRNIGALFSFAARYKCVLLLDEFDAIGKQRDDPQELGEIKRVVNTLLQNLDARGSTGFTIGVTNHEQLLDPAVWRRFEAQLLVPLPSFAARASIVRRYMEPVEVIDAGVRLLAWITEGSSGADIEQLCKSLQKRVVMASSRGAEYSLLSALQSFLPIHAGRLNHGRVQAIQQPAEDLVPELMSDPTLGLSRTEVAQLVGKDPTTISRWMQRGGGQRQARVIES